MLLSRYQDQTRVLPEFSKISTLQREMDLKGGMEDLNCVQSAEKMHQRETY